MRGSGAATMLLDVGTVPQESRTSWQLLTLFSSSLLASNSSADMFSVVRRASKASLVGARMVQRVLLLDSGPATSAAVTAASRVDMEGTMEATCNAQESVCRHQDTFQGAAW